LRKNGGRDPLRQGHSKLYFEVSSGRDPERSEGGERATEIPLKREGSGVEQEQQVLPPRSSRRCPVVTPVTPNLGPAPQVFIRYADETVEPNLGSGG
jgi:hypothetical protein